MEDQNVTLEEWRNSVEHDCLLENELSDILAQLNETLEFVNAKQTQKSEYYPFVQCRGLVADFTFDYGCGVLMDDAESIDSASSADLYGLAEDLDAAWNAVVPRIREKQKQMDVIGEAMAAFTARDWEGYWSVSKDVRDIYERLEDAFYALHDECIAIGQEALESMCGITEQAIRDCWDYWDSAEAYEEYAALYCV